MGRLRQVPCAALAAAAMLVFGAGCAEFDRSYRGTVNPATGGYGGEIVWSPAREPGQGQPSFGLRIEGQSSRLAGARTGTGQAGRTQLQPADFRGEGRGRLAGQGLADPDRDRLGDGKAVSP